MKLIKIWYQIDDLGYEITGDLWDILKFILGFALLGLTFKLASYCF